MSITTARVIGFRFALEEIILGAVMNQEIGDGSGSLVLSKDDEEGY